MIQSEVLVKSNNFNSMNKMARVVKPVALKTMTIYRVLTFISSYMISFSSYNTKKIIVLIRDNLQKKMKFVWAKSQRGGLRHSQLFSLYDLIETQKKQ